MAFGIELLHVLGCRTASPGLVQTSASQQRNNREHLGTCAQFQDRKQVREVVPQYVSGHRNRIQPITCTFATEPGCFDGSEHLDFQPLGVVIRKVLFHLGNQSGIMRPVRVQPENGQRTSRASTTDGQPDPVPNCDILRLAHSPDVACFNRVFYKHLAGFIHHSHRTGLGNLECLIVRPVFLGLLSHQPHVANISHGRHVEGTMFTAKIEYRLVDASVTTIRNHTLHLVLASIGSPHRPAIPDNDRHRCINDDVAGDMQIGDSEVRVDHRQPWLHLVDRFHIGSNFIGQFGPVISQPLDLRVQITNAVVRVDSQFLEHRGVLLEHVSVVHADSMAEDDRVRDLHHRGLHV